MEGRDSAAGVPAPAPVDLLLLAGSIAVGKTTVAELLHADYGCTIVRARSVLQEVLGGDPGWSRSRLQQEGLDLDRRTGGRWLLDYVAERLETGDRLVLDAARRRQQTELLLEGVVASRMVFLAASERVRRLRFGRAKSLDPVKASLGFDESLVHPTEREAETLRAMAHHTVETDKLSPAEVVGHVVDYIGW